MQRFHQNCRKVPPCSGPLFFDYALWKGWILNPVFFLLLMAHCYAAAVREKKDDLKFNLRFIMKSRRKYFTLKPNLFASCRCREICKNVCILSLFLDVLFYFCTSRRALDKRNKIELWKIFFSLNIYFCFNFFVIVN